MVSKNSVFFRQGPGGLFFRFLAFWGGKRLRKVDKNGNKWVSKRVLQSRCFFITFFMNFRCFLVVIFCIFFVGAFSNDGWFRKVRHTRKVWFYLVKLMIFKFRVFLQNDPKNDFRVEFRCRKEKNLWSKLPRKNDAKKRGKIMKNVEKSMPKWSAAKKSLRKANFPAFLWILVKFGLPRGGQNRQKIVKVRPKAGSKKSSKKRRFGRPPWSKEVQGSLILWPAGAPTSKYNIQYIRHSVFHSSYYIHIGSTRLCTMRCGGFQRPGGP